LIRFNRAQRSENNGAIHMSVCQKLSKINGEHIIHLSLVDSGVRHTGEYHHRVEASFFVCHIKQSSLLVPVMHVEKCWDWC